MSARGDLGRPEKRSADLVAGFSGRPLCKAQATLCSQAAFSSAQMHLASALVVGTGRSALSSHLRQQKRTATADEIRQPHSDCWGIVIICRKSFFFSVARRVTDSTNEHPKLLSPSFPVQFLQGEQSQGTLTITSVQRFSLFNLPETVPDQHVGRPEHLRRLAFGLAPARSGAPRPDPAGQPLPSTQEGWYVYDRIRATISIFTCLPAPTSRNVFDRSTCPRQ